MGQDPTPETRAAAGALSFDPAAAIAQTSPDPIFAFDSAGRVTFWNAAMERLAGRSSANVRTRTLRELFPGLEGTEEDRLQQRALSGHPGRSSAGFLLPLVGASGRVFEVDYAPLSGKDGIAGAFAVLRDITESRRVEEQRDESESRFRTMADGAPVLLWMSETDSLCSFFNQGWLEFTGRTLEMERGTGWAEGVHPEDFQRCMSVYLSAFVERRDFRMEYRLRRADGQYRWVLDTGRPRIAPDGAFEGYIGSCIDITELRDASLELQKMNVELENRVDRRTAELQHSNAELESFTYSVSHDLRAPLRAIDGFSAMLETSTVSMGQKDRHSLDRIRAGCRRMGELIDGLLALSRLSRAELVFERVDLTAMAETIAGELRASAPQRAVEFVIASGLTAKGDPRLLQVALTNLIGNAWKFTSKRARARIEVGSHLGEGGPVFFVRDDGAGFDQAHAGKLFQAFQRLHRVDEFDGTGIGLATVHRIIRRHGGKIWAEGQVDQGAVFHFTL
jgi:PAS domain S-box-containing protein